MIFHPAVLGLLFGSAVVCGLALYVGVHAAAILRGWNPASASELQLSLERRTYLISTVVAFAFAFQLASLFLFVYIADDIHGLFSGAMCAAGTLYVNRWGYPALLIKVATFLLGGVWLIINHTDNQAEDYPLIRPKYALLLAILPILAVEFVVQARYFLLLTPEVITSCCGVLFSGQAADDASEIAGGAGLPMRDAFIGGAVFVGTAGVYALRRAGGALLYACASAAFFAIAIGSLIAVFSPYIYELPTHHCPFCLLQPEYQSIGYLLYGALFIGAVSGIGAGALSPFRTKASLASIVPRQQRRLILVSLGAFGVYCGMILWRVAASHLWME